MGWIQEICDLIAKLGFYKKVNEYELGLYLCNGRAIKRKVKWGGDQLKKIVEEEEKAISDNGGMLKLMFPYTLSHGKEPVFPEGFRRSIVTGLPIHPKRYETDKVLEPGNYLHRPIFDEIVVRSQQIKPLNLGSITVPTTDQENYSVWVSCNINYQVLNLYKAYLIVHDYEESLKIHTLSELAKHSRGRSYNDWKDPKFVDKLEDEVIKGLRKIVTEDWGLKIHNVTITNNVICQVRVLAHEGNPLGLVSYNGIGNEVSG